MFIVNNSRYAIFLKFLFFNRLLPVCRIMSYISEYCVGHYDLNLFMKPTLDPIPQFSKNEPPPHIVVVMSRRLLRSFVQCSKRRMFDQQCCQKNGQDSKQFANIVYHDDVSSDRYSWRDVIGMLLVSSCFCIYTNIYFSQPCRLDSVATFRVKTSVQFHLRVIGYRSFILIFQSTCFNNLFLVALK